jgi:hypothetical protein
LEVLLLPFDLLLKVGQLRLPLFLFVGFGLDLLQKRLALLSLFSDGGGQLLLLFIDVSNLLLELLDSLLVLIDVILDF